ncbi:hypothetical protein VTK73DRAFT_6585 [Phialemonium thermophilum]|uniref:F-box domain-containing protein n=1 Tax=Phialemonium thermophilum TaxID=223376 RepID=A0ABR3WJA1_9PEZI
MVATEESIDKSTTDMPDFSASLECLAPEILCQVFAYLDIQSLLNLSNSSLIFARIFKQNWGAILFPILDRDFSPLESLLRRPELFPEEFDIPRSAWVRRRVYFAGRLVCEESSKGLLPPIRYEQKHVKHLVRFCKVVKGWEAAFPRLRFAQRAQFARTLRCHENQRLRSALYIWWRYAIMFHQDPGSAGLWMRTSRRPDVHCNYLRTLSTAQLYELQDFWETIRSAVATDLCPSVPLVLRTAGKWLSSTEASRLGWGNLAENDMIVSTVMRLLPDHLLHFLESRHVYATKHSLITAMRFLHPSIETGLETLSDALRSVIGERRDLLRSEAGHRALKRKRYFPPSSFPKPQGGILDYHVQRWQNVRTKYGNDGGKGLRDFGSHWALSAAPAPYSLHHASRGLLEPSP